MKKIITTAAILILSAIGTSATFADMRLGKGSINPPNGEFTGKIAKITYCKTNNGDAPCYYTSPWIHVNIKDNAGTSISLEFIFDDIAYGQNLIPLIGKPIHVKFVPNSEKISYFEVIE